MVLRFCLESTNRLGLSELYRVSPEEPEEKERKERRRLPVERKERHGDDGIGCENLF
jgi:hypothetical protein